MMSMESTKRHLFYPFTCLKERYSLKDLIVMIVKPNICIILDDDIGKKTIINGKSRLCQLFGKAAILVTLLFVSRLA